MFKLPKLKYGLNDLEPYYEERTVEIHYSKHHQNYINNLNDAIAKYPELKNHSIEELLMNLDKIPSEIKKAVINNGGGHYNHTLFWNQFKKNPGVISGKILILINKDFGSFEKFKDQFDNMAKTNFGSGWTWLVLNQNLKLEIINTANQDCPLSLNLKPLLVIDVWEHAYYLQYQNRRAEWIDAFWKIIDWDFVNQELEK